MFRPGNTRNYHAIWTGLAALSLVLLIVPAPRAHAQLTCEEVPEPLTQAFVDSMSGFFVGSDGTQFWTTDFCQFEDGVWSEIAHGGPPPDGIPPVDDPQFDTIETASEWLQPQSPVIAIEIEGDARAYPLAILTRHEIVNDEIGGVPVAVTFCPLCNSAIVFKREVEGETLRFGVSGFLRHSDLIMWDNLTQSWWQQLTGRGIVGTYTGTELDLVPSQLVGFAAFTDQFPDGQVMSREGTGYSTSTYGGNPYVSYDSLSGPFQRFFDYSKLDDRLPAMERVLAGLVRGNPVAYPFAELATNGVINDTVGEVAVVALWQPGSVSALDARLIDESYDVGMAALFNRDLDGQALTFRIDEDGLIRDDQTDSVWNIFGLAVEGELAGSQLQQEPAFPHFWFAWAAFQPETVIYDAE